MTVGGGGKIMASCGYFRVLAAKLWLVVAGGGKIMAGRGWLWMVARFSNAHSNLQMSYSSN